MLPDVSEKKVVNESTVVELMGRDKDGEPLLKRLFDIYLEETPRLLNELENAVALKDEQLIYDTIHQMKGSSAAMGATRVYATTEAALNLCKDGVILRVENLVSVISVETSLYIEDLKKRL